MKKHRNSVFANSFYTNLNFQTVVSLTGEHSDSKKVIISMHYFSSSRCMPIFILVRQLVLLACINSALIMSPPARTINKTPHNSFREIFKFREDNSNNEFREILKCFRKTAKFEFFAKKLYIWNLQITRFKMTCLTYLCSKSLKFFRTSKNGLKSDYFAKIAHKIAKSKYFPDI